MALLVVTPARKQRQDRNDLFFSPPCTNITLLFLLFVSATWVGPAIRFFCFGLLTVPKMCRLKKKAGEYVGAVFGCVLIWGFTAFFIYFPGHGSKVQLRNRLVLTNCTLMACSHDLRRHNFRCQWSFVDVWGSVYTSSLTVQDEQATNNPTLSALQASYGQIKQLWYDPSDPSDIYLDKRSLDVKIENWRIASIVFACIAALPFLCLPCAICTCRPDRHELPA